MPRWKQVFNCTNPECRRRRWREVETHPSDPPPNLARLLAKARCTGCGCQTVEGRQYNIGPRVDDQMKPGGMCLGLTDFRSCCARDRERREALALYRARHGVDYVDPRDPEFGGPVPLEP